MLRQPELNEQEWTLLLDLLETERRELPPEIHHTDSRQVHDELTQRLKMVESLLTRLRAPADVH